MAFQQPTRQSAPRVFRPASEDDELQQVPQPAPRDVEDPQTWVLFSPPTDTGTSTSYLTSTHQTNSTPGRSRLSEIGSLGTAARSDASAVQQQSTSFVEVPREEDEDDAELDSLDSHLPEFRSMPTFYDASHALAHTTPVVPAHDGLGLFRLEQEVMGFDIQEQLYAFEQYNPNRLRRQEGVGLGQVELDVDRAQELEKMQRIESWRLEHSRYLLEEIKKETRRRRRSAASMPKSSHMEREAEDVASMSGIGDASSKKADQSQDWHDQDETDPEAGQESIWGRITRKVIRDLMGIDDKLLSVLFGEALPDEEDLSSTPKASAIPVPQQCTNAPMENATDSGWQLKMLERVAKELGVLIHRLSEHPGAFSTFSRVQQMPIPYAGLPPIPEGANDTATTVKTDKAPTIPEFQPTIGKRTQPIDVPHVAQPASSTHAENPGSAFTQDEWEQELDVRLVFRYLRSRFISRSSSSGGVAGNSSLASSSTQDMAAKAARVRQHHPLVSRPRPAERRKSKATIPSSPVFKHASSCASQSTRRSIKKSSSSSRHYWDIGGSVGTGSMIATTGPMGSWGEV
ncbi:uncharacterized protein GGS25DRAFT_375961 [Hypoxylon fragiforme]|uniref:uncharacterized protein n=1 Tax=Hypoxylon fragiforme TaxID=63214 RepID=UPI0020C6F1AF|nr:uncharacterized protein GGS25DRAFT_375961 [Hypoxylon fragiforme]KAI2606162.1 hypothetical protein GGS25DRAFT_375961 [Hypoxylon fragiforme]